MCFAVSEIGDAFAATADGADVQTKQAYVEISGLGGSLDQRVRRDMESQFLERVIGPLDAMLNDMAAVKVRPCPAPVRGRAPEGAPIAALPSAPRQADVRRREELKREYDHYYFKVRSLKEKGSDDPRKLQRVRAATRGRAGRRSRQAERRHCTRGSAGPSPPPHPPAVRTRKSSTSNGDRCRSAPTT